MQHRRLRWALEAAMEAMAARRVSKEMVEEGVDSGKKVLLREEMNYANDECADSLTCLLVMKGHYKRIVFD